MFEFGIRLVIAAAIFAFSNAFGIPPTNLAWASSSAVVVLGFINLRLEVRGELNSGYAGIMAVADSFIIAILLGATNTLHTLGFLVLLPVINANLRHDSQSSSMAPIASGGLFASYAIFSNNAPPQGTVMAQAAAVMATGLILGALKPKHGHSSSHEPVPVSTSDGVIEIRESYRNLRKAYQELERRTKKPVRLAQLEEVQLCSHDQFFQTLARKLAEIAGIENVSVYALAQFESSMVVRGSFGDMGAKLDTAAVSVKIPAAISLIRSRTDLALNALKDDGDSRRVANVLLTESGRMIGMLALSSIDEALLEEARLRLEEVSKSIAAMISTHTRNESLYRRARQAELLYETACVTHGAITAPALAERVVQQLWDLAQADHISLTLVSEDLMETLSSRGSRLHLMDSMRFATGPGLSGWRHLGFPEVSIFDARNDERLDSSESLKQRIGSACIVPIADEYGYLGYLSMATHRSGGIDTPDVEMLRTVGMELGRAFTGLRKRDLVSEGLMSSTEFQELVGSASEGCLVILETIKPEEIEETFGRPALEHAIRQLGNRLRAKLPTGGALCRKPQGAYVAYLPGADDEIASRWANDATAIASLIGLSTPDGSARIPLGLRAKVAEIDRQEDEIFTLEAS